MEGSKSNIIGIKIPCKGDGNEGQLIPAPLADTHPIFTKGEICPVSEALGIPLLIFRCRPNRQPGPGYDMQNATAVQLRIKMDNFFAPMDWQFEVGPVLMVRKDKKPLLPNHLELLIIFNKKIMASDPADDDGTRSRVTKDEFIKLWDKYKKMMIWMDGEYPGRRQPVHHVPWKNLANPFEI